MVLSALIPSTSFVTTSLESIFVILSLLILVERSTWIGNYTVDMQHIRFNYSLKNIGLPSHDEYRRNIIEKTESAIQRMRWKAHFLHGNENQQTKNTPTYGLKSKRTAPQLAEMKHFEDDVAQIIESIKFKNTPTNLSSQ